VVQLVTEIKVALTVKGGQAQVAVVLAVLVLEGQAELHQRAMAVKAGHMIFQVLCVGTQVAVAVVATAVNELVMVMQVAAVEPAQLLDMPTMCTPLKLTQ
jgi:hypothetical protein